MSKKTFYVLPAMEQLNEMKQLKMKKEQTVCFGGWEVMVRVLMQYPKIGAISF